VVVRYCCVSHQIWVVNVTVQNVPVVDVVPIRIILGELVRHVNTLVVLKEYVVVVTAKDVVRVVVTVVDIEVPVVILDVIDDVTCVTVEHVVVVIEPETTDIPVTVI
jgi:hypothetical protein